MRITITSLDALAVHLLGLIGRYQWKDAPDSSAMPGQCERPTPRTDRPVRFYIAGKPMHVRGARFQHQIAAPYHGQFTVALRNHIA